MAPSTPSNPTLISGVRVFSPQDIGKKDIFIAGGKILAMADELPPAGFSGLAFKRIDANGLLATPGLIDSLTHIAGGGGEDGFGGRTPPMQPQTAIRAGVTSLVACLGTDAITRQHGDLVAHARHFRAHGVHAWCYTGSYEIPVRTLTGSIGSDLVWIDEMIGVGEIALGDHRGAQPTVGELARLASESRRAGMLAGKSGIVSIHLGDDPTALELLTRVCTDTPLPIQQFYPTHTNRTAEVFEAARAHAQRGGLCDVTTSTTPALLKMGEVPAAQAVARLLADGIDVSRISMSSDAQASLPAFVASGALEGVEVGKMSSLWQAVQAGVKTEGVDFSQMLSTVTSTPAKILGLDGKGSLAVGQDADVLLIEPDTLSLHSVLSGGRCLFRDGKPVLG